ncbi:MAG TPA: ABC transporter ATP-binding protein [Tissierellia bacterium]|nr:ABC transporter ATP-binding protein [Tissierellia bacterium]
MFLELNDLSKMYDEHNGVRSFDLSVEEGEFVTMLGPSGCGKTTVLNMLGGFLRPDGGEIILDGRDITRTIPEERPVATVFQNYALFSNLNVIDNVAYGLRYYHQLKKSAARKAARKYLELVGLSDYAQTMIYHLSGGQQQRVALARSLAIEPKLLLLDEPFSNLDAALRNQVRQDLKALQKKTNITMLFVTHDQEEALFLSDRIVVMRRGEISQVGTPKEIYYQPQTEDVAQFVGSMNQTLSIRPEDLTLKAGGEAVIERISFYGAYTDYLVRQDDDLILIKSFGKQPDWQPGQAVTIEKE